MYCLQTFRSMLPWWSSCWWLVRSPVLRCTWSRSLDLHQTTAQHSSRWSRWPVITRNIMEMDSSHVMGKYWYEKMLDLFKLCLSALFLVSQTTFLHTKTSWDWRVPCLAGKKNGMDTRCLKGVYNVYNVYNEYQGVYKPPPEEDWIILGGVLWWISLKVFTEGWFENYVTFWK